jgi:predicted nucleic acid-binding protein
MRSVVLDASVVLKWFARGRERERRHAGKLRRDHERGAISVLVPPLLFLESVNVAARGWRWGEDALLDLVDALRGLLLDVREPELEMVAVWAARGLSAYDAAYVALAETLSTELVTDDETIVEIAPEVAVPLASY